MGGQSRKDHPFESSQGNVEDLVEGGIRRREGKEMGRQEGTNGRADRRWTSEADVADH